MQWEKVELAARMQNYIRDHCMDADFTMDALYEAAGYSRRHACRIFKELMDKTPEEYVRAVQMTASAESLIKTDSTILDIALDTDFESHEGYTRAFNKLFGTTPSRYRHGQVPIPLFVQYPIQHYYSYLKQKEIQEMENQSNTPQERESSQSICTVTVIHKPARKLLVMYAQKAHDYFSFCEEMSCEWEGLFNSCSYDPSPFPSSGRHHRNRCRSGTARGYRYYSTGRLHSAVTASLRLSLFPVPSL